MKRGPFAVVAFAVIAAVGVPLFASPQSVGIPMLLGSARTHCGHTVRLVAFASLPGHSGAGGFTFISLGHVQKFLEEYLREHWDVLCHAQFKDPAFGFEVLLGKARRGQTQDCSWQPRVIRVPTRSEESAVYGQLAQSQKHAM